MSFLTQTQPQSSPTKTGGSFLTARTATPTGKLDLSTAAGLADYARQVGLEEQVNKIIEDRSKLSTLQRLGKGLGAFNPAEAILTGQEKGVGAGILQYPKSILTGIASAVTGKDYEKDRRYFADAVKEWGVENSVAKFGLGIAGDILLDPTTYFGGALVKGLLKGSKVGADLAVSGLAKVAPDLAEGVVGATKNLQEGLGKTFVSGYGTRPGLYNRGAELLTQADKAIQEQVMEPLWKTFGHLTKDQANEVALGMLGAKELQYNLEQLYGLSRGAEKVANATTMEGAEALGNNLLRQNIQKAAIEYVRQNVKNPELQKIIFSQNDWWGPVQKMAGVTDPFEVYFPGLDSTRIANFLSGSRSIKVGSKPWLRQYTNSIPKEFLITDPVGAFAKRGTQVVKNSVYENGLKQIGKEFGKSWDDFEKMALKENPALKGEELRRATERLISNTGFSPLYASGDATRAYRGAVETLDGTKTYIGLKGNEPIAYLPTNEVDFLQGLTAPSFQWADKIAQATGFDAVTSLFKRSVTGLFLPFHVRNWVSGIVQNFEAVGPAALDPQTMGQGMSIAGRLLFKKDIPNVAVKTVAGEIPLSHLVKRFEDRFGFGHSQYISDITDATAELKIKQPILTGGKLDKQALKQSAKETLKTAGLGQDSIPFRSARAVGQFIETQQKATAYLAALKQGKTVDEALTLAERAGFDYRMLTPFESKVMRRIVPFYAFTRKNVELQLKTLKENPERINQIMSLFRNLNPGDSKENLPQYVQDSLGIKWGDLPNGIVQYIVSLGTPVEQFSNLVGSNMVLRGISQMNPLLKVPIEIGIGKDSFRQKDLKDVYDAREYSSAPQIVKDLLDITTVQRPILRKNASGKLEKVGERTVYAADPVKLLVARSLFTSRGVTYLDEVFGGDLQGLAKVLKLTTGIKVNEFDLEQMEGIEEAKKRGELEQMLIKYGQGAQIKKFFIPKE